MGVKVLNKVIILLIYVLMNMEDPNFVNEERYRITAS